MLIGIGFIGLIALAAFVGKLPYLVVGAYLVLSAVAFTMYAVDKSKARNNQWRISESTLHLLSLIGGWPGALVAQQVFRHKRKKEAFRTVFWMTVIVNCAALVWLFLPSGTSAPGAILGSS
jgi:uncharacterized membrane protein YsdA (DUF1294 family)